MAKKDIVELQRRMTKDGNNITFLAGCLVEPDGTIGEMFRERLAAMREEEYFKYLDKIQMIYAHKKYGDAVKQVDVCMQGAEILGIMERAIESEMKDDDILRKMFEIVAVEVIYSETRHAVLIWNDIYDILKTNKNNEQLDESEEVLNSIGCMVCPVHMDKEGLAYDEELGKFVAKDREWIMGAPEFAFTWPSLVDRSPDTDVVTLYMGNPADVPHEFASEELGCKPFLTRTEVQKMFGHAVMQGVDEPDDLEPALEMINYRFGEMLDRADNKLNKEQMLELLTYAGVKNHVADKIARSYDRIFDGMPQSVDDLYVKKYATAYERKMKVLRIKQTLNQAADALDSMTNGQSGDLTLDIRRVAAGL